VTQTVPIAEGILSLEPGEAPQLIGGKCRSCALVTFPQQGSCARCSGVDIGEHLLPRRGRLWAWTTQDFAPPSPPYTGPTGEDFVPYGVGFVELPGEVRVESRLTSPDPAVLRNGMDVELVVVPFRHTEEGDEVVMFAFAPIAEALATEGGAA
jgi:uncharacterized OB-fold protein